MMKHGSKERPGSKEDMSRLLQVEPRQERMTLVEVEPQHPCVVMVDHDRALDAGAHRHISPTTAGRLLVVDA